MRSKIVPCISSCSVVRGWGGGGGSPEEILKNEECGRRHLRSFCNAIKVSNLPELCYLQMFQRRKSPFIPCFEAGALAGNQKVAGSILNPGIFFRGVLFIKNILRSFSPFR